MYVCVRACVRACECACVRACVGGDVFCTPVTLKQGQGHQYCMNIVRPKVMIMQCLKDPVTVSRGIHRVLFVN